MIACRITDLKTFTKQLFMEQLMDRFLVSEAGFATAQTIQIDGMINREFFGAEQPAWAADGYLPWEQLRPLCFQMIKGRRLPLSFKIVFRLPSEKLSSILESAGASIAPEDVDALFLNLVYRNDTMLLTTGTSLKIFTLDKSLDTAWDRYVRWFLEERGVSWEEA